MDEVASTFYGDEQVTAIISLKIDSKEVEKAAIETAKFEEVIDVFLVTGDSDMIIKVKLNNYQHLKEFVTHQLPTVTGIRESKTLVVVSAYKENGVKKTP